MRLNLARLVLSQSCSVFFCVVSLQVADHLVDVVLERRHFALRLDRDRAGQVALGHGGGHFGDRAHLRGQVGRELVHVVGEVLPGAGGARAPWPGRRACPSTPTSRATVVTWSANVASVSIMLLIVSASAAISPLASTRQLALQVAVGDRGHDLGDAAHLVGQVRGHEVDVVGQVLPGAGHALHLGLAAQLAFGADFAGHAGHFRGERAELVHHRVDGVLQLEDLALDVDGDLLRQVAVGDGRGHLGDVAHLVGQVAGHEVHVVGQVLPGARRRPARRPGRRACLRCRPRAPRGSPRRRTS